MKQSNLYGKLLVLLLFCTFASGCWGARETDEVALVVAVGFDKGKTEALEVTATVANPRAFTIDGGGGNAKPFLNISVEGPSIWECYTLLNSFLSRETTFSHTQVYLFGEELARQGIENYINDLIRQREVRRDSGLYVCRGTAKEFMDKNKPLLEMSVAKQYQFMDRMAKVSGLFHNRNIHDYYSTYKNLHSSPTLGLVGVSRGKPEDGKQAAEPLRVPYVAGEVPRTGENKAEYIGAAIFNRDKMVGEINGDENRTLMLLRGDFTVSSFTIRDPKHPNKTIVLRLRQGQRPDIKFKQEEGVLKIYHTVYLEGEFVSIQSGEHYEDPAKQKIVEDAFDRGMEELARELIDKTREKDWGDIIHYDRYYRRELSSWEQWENLNWQEIYNNADIMVDFKTNIRRTGLVRKMVPPYKE